MIELAQFCDSQQQTATALAPSAEGRQKARATATEGQGQAEPKAAGTRAAYLKVPRELIFSLSPSELKLALIMLCLDSKGLGCFARQERLAELAHMSRATVAGLLRQLTAKGLFHKQREPGRRSRTYKPSECLKIRQTNVKKLDTSQNRVRSDGKGSGGQFFERHRAICNPLGRVFNNSVNTLPLTSRSNFIKTHEEKNGGDKVSERVKKKHGDNLVSESEKKLSAPNSKTGGQSADGWRPVGDGQLENGFFFCGYCRGSGAFEKLLVRHYEGAKETVALCPDCRRPICQRRDTSVK